MTSYTDADDLTTEYGYDAKNNLTKITTPADASDPGGEVANMTYDSSGRVLSVTRVTNNSTGVGDTTTYAYYAPQSEPTGTGAPPACPVSSTLFGETVETGPNGSTTTYCYDTHDRVYKTLDDVGNLTQDPYNTDDDTTSSTDPTGDPTTYGFDSCFRAIGTTNPASAHNQTPAQVALSYATPASACSTPSSAQTLADYVPTTSTDAQHDQTAYGYDGDQDLMSVTDQLVANNQINLKYNPDGQVISSTNADGTGPTAYTYMNGNLTTITPPTPLGPVTLGYDADGRVTSVIDADSATPTTYMYDNLDRVTEQTNPDGSTFKYTYDPEGDVLTAVDSSTGTTTDTYDLKNRLVSEVAPGPAGGPSTTTTYGYDGDDNLASLTDAGGTVTYGYHNHDDLPTSVQEPGVSTAIALAYDTDGRLVCTTYPGGVAIQDAYDTTDDITSVQAANGAGAACNPSSTTGTPSGSVYSSYVYKYATAAHPTVDTALRQSLTINGGTNPWYYTYDALDRLKTATMGTTSLSYGYDGDGNLTTKGSSTYTYNAADQITNTGYTYDPDGKLLTRLDPSGTTTLAYNARNQTTSINPDGTGALILSYLGSGQEDPIQIGNAPPLGTAPHVTDNALGVSSQTTAGTPSQPATTTYYTRAPDGTLLGERTPTGNYYYTPDGNGSIVDLTNSTGTIANPYTYDPYGTTTTSTGTTANSFGFDSGFQSPGGLYHFGQRYYDPNAGSWTQQDPLDSPTSLTQADRYDFAGDDPVNDFDPYGLYDVKSTVVACAKSGIQSGVLSGGDPVAAATGCVAGAASDAVKQAGCDVCSQAIDIVGNAADIKSAVKFGEGLFNDL